MPEVVVNRLRLRETAERAGGTLFGIEDSLRTEIPDTSRLVLVQRMVLRPEAASRDPRQRASAVRAAYADATGHALHGSSSGAASGNCVWFQSADEARRLLLRALLRGLSVHGWFWPLAVPEWQALPLERWTRRILDKARNDGDDAALVMIAAEFTDAGRADDLVTLLAGEWTEPLALAGNHAESPIDSPSGRAAPTAAMPDGILPVERLLASRIAARMPSALRGALVRLAGQANGPGRIVAERLAQVLAIRAAPALSLNPARKAAVSRALLAALGPGVGTAPTRPDDAPARLTPSLPGEPDQAHAPLTKRPPVPDAKRPGAASVAEAEPDAGPRRSRREAAARKQGETAIALFRHSAAAGLWLAVPSLIRMGFREWLAAETVPLAADPGRALLRHCAARHRIAPNDPAMAPLLDGEETDAGDAPAWLEAWRRALDHWLRRQARTSLHALVWRHGWLHPADGRLMVRFPLASADIRLRRRALDADPGWVDWLGLSVRYRFSDEALP